MIEFLQQLVNGLSLGAIYALIALGYTMVYGVLRFINFAHGDVYMLGAFTGFYVGPWFLRMFGGTGSLFVALLVVAAAMIVCAIIGIVIEKLAYRPLRDRPRLTVLITAIGVSIFLESVGQTTIGPNPQYFPEIMPDVAIEGLERFGLGDLTITTGQVLVFCVTLVLMVGLTLIVLRTKMGTAMRALSLNPVATSLMGVNNDVIISFTFGLGSAFAGAAGILVSILQPSIDPLMGIVPGLKAFVAAVLGGIGNIPGAALGGFIIGIVETLVVGYSDKLHISPQYKDGVAFAILILILLFKPAGLLGKVEREKV